MGKATSSITTVVPILRAAPTAGKSPRRTSQSASAWARSEVNAASARVGMPAIRSAARAIRSASAAGSAARTSTSSAQAPSGRPRSDGGMPGLASTARSEARSISSAAATRPPCRAWVARAAWTTSGKSTSALARCGWSSTVRSVTSETKPSVPSEPTSRCTRMSIGSAKSRNEFSP